MIRKYVLILCLLGQTLLFGQEKQPLVTVTQMHQDVAILKDAFTQLHPGVYRYITPAQLNNYFEDVLKRINQPLGLSSFYMELSKLTVKFHCGHTYVNPYNQKKKVTDALLSGQVLPLLFQVIHHRFIITHNLSVQFRIKAGDELLSINGISSATIIDSLLTVSRADGEHGLSKQLDNIGISPYLAGFQKYALFDIYFPLFFSKMQHSGYYDIAIRPFRGNVIHLQIASLTKQQRQQSYQERYPAEYKRPTGAFSWLTQKSGYLRITEFNTKGWGGDYKVFLDSIFTDLHTQRTSQLVVDIRGNEGGDDGVRNELISYLIRQPASYAIRRYYRFLTVPATLMPYLDTWDSSFKKPKAATDFEKTAGQLYFKKNNGAMDTIIPKEKHFNGKIYLLINATNSSSSFFMADILQQNKAVELVGEPTGGTKQGINGGQFFFLTLPGSGIEVDIPLVFQAPIHNRPDEGIQPDVIVRTKQRNIAHGVDAQLQYLTSRD